jgi:hypothetical protein
MFDVDIQAHSLTLVMDGTAVELVPKGNALEIGLTYEQAKELESVLLQSVQEMEQQQDQLANLFIDLDFPELQK